MLKLNMDPPAAAPLGEAAGRLLQRPIGLGNHPLHKKLPESGRGHFRTLADYFAPAYNNRDSSVPLTSCQHFVCMFVSSCLNMSEQKNEDLCKNVSLERQTSRGARLEFLHVSMQTLII